MKDALNKIVPNAIYKLTKVKTHNPDSRYAKDGDDFVGQAYTIESMDGQTMLVVGNIRTSPLVEVVELDGSFAIQTKNSGYILVRMDM